MDQQSKAKRTAPPSDPTANTNNLFADTTGLTGMTQNTTNNDVGQEDGGPNDTASSQTIQRENDIASEKDTNYQPPKGMSAPYQPESPTINLSDEGHNKKYAHPVPPSVQGEQSNSGDMPDPDSDNDTLANAQYMGMQANEDTEHPQEVDIARDVDNAEEYLRTH